MKLRTTASFDRDYAKLARSIQNQVDKQLVLLLSNPRHPSLNVKKMSGRQGIWECRVSEGCRITFQVDADCFLLRRVGGHDILKTP